MPRSTRAFVTVLWTLTAWALVLPSAQAYVDPGSTSVIFQALIAAIAAAGTALAMFRTKLRAMFSRSKPSSDDDGEHV